MEIKSKIVISGYLGISNTVNSITDANSLKNVQNFFVGLDENIFRYVSDKEGTSETVYVYRSLNEKEKAEIYDLIDELEMCGDLYDGGDFLVDIANRTVILNLETLEYSARFYTIKPGSCFVFIAEGLDGEKKAFASFSSPCYFITKFKRWARFMGRRKGKNTIFGTSGLAHYYKQYTMEFRTYDIPPYAINRVTLETLHDIETYNYKNLQIDSFASEVYKIRDKDNLLKEQNLTGTIHMSVLLNLKQEEIKKIPGIKVKLDVQDMPYVNNIIHSYISNMGYVTFVVKDPDKFDWKLMDRWLDLNYNVITENEYNKTCVTC